MIVYFAKRKMTLSGRAIKPGDKIPEAFEWSEGKLMRSILAGDIEYIDTKLGKFPFRKSK
jgi:hypothetical protein